MTPPVGLERWLDHFGVTQPQPVAETGIATVWKVKRDGSDAVLKLYKGGDMQDEAPGVAFLQDAGDRAVRILGLADGAVLMERLGGPALGDLVRRGDIGQADAALAEVARSLGPVPVDARFNPPQVWMDALLTCTQGGAFARARELAVTLLEEPQPARVLHGDLHHDNVMRGNRGWCAIDAKGIVGAPGYELANGFRNPVGAEGVWRDPAHIRRRLALWSTALGEPPRRMMGWAAVHLALSILWDQCAEDHVDYPMVDVFLGILAEQN